MDAALPVDQVPLVWRSKQAIYYAFAAVATVSGYETYQVLSTLCALLLAFAAVGLYVLARELLLAPRRRSGRRDGASPASTAWSCTPASTPTSTRRGAT